MPDIFFDGWGNIVSIAVTAPLVYLAIIAFIRLSGKRSTSQMNNFDWIVTVAMGSLVGSLLVIEDVTLAEAVFAIGLLMGLQYLFTLGAARFDWVERVIKSRPTLLFDGNFRRSAMREERITESEINAAVRENGLNHLSDVRWVVLESDASFSVVPRRTDHDQDELIGLPGAHSTRKS
ncbi:DUF421 domain-containing protein [Hyphobacterium sp. SN044]|uniref:DUF421 domain-containing protein n=1 Tax=Hyphobacterium sp. SN044 TaxID=2912575 RepID=UPI001F2AE6AB|nr:YetF domain-containing protein [Hyphobacterium sp. SN044]MCF8880032.1 DUF421 domain-containing protein [Hyphobacterium sp. SN044]